MIAGGLAIVLLLICGGIGYYQSARFNPHVSINGLDVGGMTAEQVQEKLATWTLKNDVYIGDERIYDGKDTKAVFTEEDLPEIRQLLKKQRTWFPSSEKKAYTLMPGRTDRYRTETLRQEVSEKLKEINQKLKAPKDAQAALKDGKITVSKSEKGEQYDLNKLLKDYDRQDYKSEIRLEPVRLQPILEDSEIVKNETGKLQELLGRSVDYRLQDKTHHLTAGELIKQATVSKEMKVTVEADELRDKVAEINQEQSTLHKNFAFKTHSGREISVKGGSYGWALDVDKETERIKTAFEKGEGAIQAEHIYGEGYSTYGIGYDNTTNHGIGHTYVEVSISEQRMWVYKNGKAVLTTHVVTGRHDTHEDTPKGVWYVMYKESPSILEGSEAGNPHYRVKVSYWAPFTMSGCGFHDAGWRTNWSKDAYLKHGSGGCVNIPPNVMDTVYASVSQNDPVIVY